MPTQHTWLEKLHEDFVEALRSNDLKVLGAFYTDDAVLLPPGQGMVAGRPAIVEYWESSKRIQDLSFEATAVRMMADDTILREAGNLLVTSRGRGRETRNTASKYVSLWLKVDGAWKLDSTAWNGAGDRPRRGAGGGRRGGGGGGGGGAAGRRGEGDGPAAGGGGGRGRQGGGGGRGRQGGGGDD